jgi:hypothetical protein
VPPSLGCSSTKKRNPDPIDVPLPKERAGPEMAGDKVYNLPTALLIEKDLRPITVLHFGEMTFDLL